MHDTTISLTMAAVNEKKQRSLAKSNFTRNINKLNSLLDNNVSQAELVTPQFDKVNECYELLEKAHQEFLKATDINIEEDDDGFAYMEKCDETHATTVGRYSEFLRNEREQQLLVERTSKDDQEKREIENRRMVEQEMKATEQLKLTEERKQKFDSEKAQLTSGIAAFKRMSITMKDNLSEVSAADRRLEFGKVESEFL